MSQNLTPPASPLQPPAHPAPAAPSRRNAVGIIGLIAGIVGFVCACIPGALIIGWILLPVAFVLGIVALCLKGKTKWQGLVALILGVVGPIVGAVVFFVVVAGAVDDAIDEASGGETVITEESAEADDQQSAAEPDEAEAAAGTRENPVAFGSTIKNEDWAVVLSDFNPDANDQVVDGMFNDAPGDGETWITFVPTVTHHGDESDLAAMVQFAYVAADGTVIDSLDTIAILDDGYDASAELYDGASESGVYALMVPEGGDGLIRVTPGLLADEVFVALP